MTLATPAATLSNRYRVSRELSAGCMAEFHSARGLYELCFGRNWAKAGRSSVSQRARGERHHRVSAGARGAGERFNNSDPFKPPFEADPLKRVAEVYLNRYIR